MSATVTVEQKFLTRLNNIGPEGSRIAKASVSAVADMIVADAKRLAPADLGTIRQNIGKEIKGEGDQVYAAIYASAPESAFQEFGTGGKVDVPVMFQDVAASFKGAQGGNFAAFVAALTGWVKRRGINPIGAYRVSTRARISKSNKTDLDEQTAYAIARSILKNGLKPQPFLYPAYIGNNWKLLPMLQTAFKQLTGTLNK